MSERAWKEKVENADEGKRGSTVLAPRIFLNRVHLGPPTRSKFLSRACAGKVLSCRA